MADHFEVSRAAFKALFKEAVIAQIRNARALMGHTPNPNPDPGPDPNYPIYPDPVILAHIREGYPAGPVLGPEDGDPFDFLPDYLTGVVNTIDLELFQPQHMGFQNEDDVRRLLAELKRRTGCEISYDRVMSIVDRLDQNRSASESDATSYTTSADVSPQHLASYPVALPGIAHHFHQRTIEIYAPIGLAGTAFLHGMKDIMGGSNPVIIDPTCAWANLEVIIAAQLRFGGLYIEYERVKITTCSARSRNLVLSMLPQIHRAMQAQDLSTVIVTRLEGEDQHGRFDPRTPTDSEDEERGPVRPRAYQNAGIHSMMPPRDDDGRGPDDDLMHMTPVERQTLDDAEAHMMEEEMVEPDAEMVAGEADPAARLEQYAAQRDAPSMRAATRFDPAFSAPFASGTGSTAAQGFQGIFSAGSATTSVASGSSGSGSTAPRFSRQPIPEPTQKQKDDLKIQEAREETFRIKVEKVVAQYRIEQQKTQVMKDALNDEDTGNATAIDWHTQAAAGNPGTVGNLPNMPHPIPTDFYQQAEQAGDAGPGMLINYLKEHKNLPRLAPDQDWYMITRSGRDKCTLQNTRPLTTLPPLDPMGTVTLTYLAASKHGRHWANRVLLVSQRVLAEDA